MSSSLIGYNVLEKSDLEFTLSIELWQEEYIVTSKNYALQFIVEAYRNIKKGYIYNTDYQYYPFSKDEGKELIKQNAEYLDPLLEILDPKQIITEQQYKTLQETEDMSFEGKKITGYGMSDGIYYVSFEIDYDLFCEQAEQLIESVECKAVEQYPHWNNKLQIWLDQGSFYEIPQSLYDENEAHPKPQYSLTIKVSKTHQSLLDHIIANSRWDSTNFDYAGYTKSFVHPILPPSFLLEPSENSSVLSDQAVEGWWSALDTPWQETLAINYNLQASRLFPSLVGQAINIRISSVWERFSEAPATIPTAQRPQLSQMKALFATYAKLKTLEPIRQLKGLELVDLTGNQFEDISPLSELKHLKYLHLTECYAVNDLSVFSELKQLQHLYVDQTNKPLSFKVLEGLDRLQSIQFFTNEMADLEVLLNLPKLKKLTGFVNSMKPSQKEVIKQLEEKGITVALEIEEA